MPISTWDYGAATFSRPSRRPDLRDIFSRIADRGQGIDLAALFCQPLSWDGIANPFSLLPHQASVDMSARLTLNGAKDEDAINQVLSSSMRSRLRGKERKLQNLAGYRYMQATTAADVDRLLDSFFALKSTHMAAQGLGNVFAEAGVAEFLREACHCTLANGRPLIEIHALEGGGEVLALFGTIVDDYRFSSMFNTYTLGDNARYSPGLILLVRIVNETAARGVRSFDIGVGRAQYKSFFCHQLEPLFDTFLPLTPRGRLAAAACGAIHCQASDQAQSDVVDGGQGRPARPRARLRLVPPIEVPAPPAAN